MEQRILLITHSNQALNEIFEKLMLRNIDEKYLLRLGYGAHDIDLTKSKQQSNNDNSNNNWEYCKLWWMNLTLK